MTTTCPAAVRGRRGHGVRAGLGLARPVQPGRGGRTTARRRPRPPASRRAGSTWARRLGPLAYGLLADQIGYGGAWAVVAGVSLAGSGGDGAGRPGRRGGGRAPRRARRGASARRTAGRASRRRRARPRRSPRWRPASPARPPPARASTASAGLAAASITRLARPTARGAAASSSPAKRVGGLVERVGRGDPVGEADPVRLVAVDHLAGHDQLLRAADAHDGRQARAAAHVRQQAHAHLHDPGHRVLGHRCGSRRPAPARRRRPAPRRGSGRSWASASPRAGSTSRSAGGGSARRPSGFSERSRRSFRSMPEENMAPSPRTITTRTDVVVGRGLDAPGRAPGSARRSARCACSAG